MLSVETIAAEMNVSERTAYRWMLRMTHFREGRTLRVSRPEFERWKAERTCASSGDDSDETEASEKRGGRTSTGSGSRRAKPPSRTRAGGKPRSSDDEPIHVVQPRKTRRSATP